MALQLAVATAMVLLTVLIHGAGISGLNRILRLAPHETHHFDLTRASRTMGIVLALFMLHGIEIWLFAVLYLSVGAIPDLETAVYFSTITYAAIGYSDVAVHPGWRLVGAIEGINGVILLGWSTAFFVSVVARLRR